MNTAKLTLTSANMGDVTEADFDAWTAYVAEHVDEASGYDVTVDQARFGEPGDDRIATGHGVDEQPVRDALVTLWEQFCADDSAWPARETA